MDAIRQLALELVKLIVCGYSAYPAPLISAFRAIADEVGAFLLADMAHIAGWWRQVFIPAGSSLRCGDYHHPQDPAGTTWRSDSLRDADFAKKFDKAVFPGGQGGPLEHVIAAKAVAFGELQPPSRSTASRWWRIQPLWLSADRPWD